MKNVFLFIFFFVLIFSLYFSVFEIFYTQDDFILIRYFSSFDFLTDLKHVFGPPTVQHFRPMVNMYYFLGNFIPNGFYQIYHLILLLIQTTSTFIVYKIIKYVLKKKRAAFVGSVFFASNPSHFVSLYWISGITPVLAFMFLALSIYFYLLGRKLITSIFLLLSILSSEAMIVGLAVLLIISHVEKRLNFDKLFFARLTFLIGLFSAIRFTLLLPRATLDVYNLDFSVHLPVLKYYFFRVAGFGEAGRDKILSLLIIIWLFTLLGVILLRGIKRNNIRVFFAGLSISILGLLPYIFIPNHLSGHYMILSIFGTSLCFSMITLKFKKVEVFLFLAAFLVVSFLNIKKFEGSSWVVERSSFSRSLLKKVENENIPGGKTIVFSDGEIISSREAYIALGAGEGLNYMFKEKDYEACFTFLKVCNSTNSYLIKI